MGKAIGFYKALFSENKYWLKKTAIWAVFWFALGILVFAVYPQGIARFMGFLNGIFEEIFEGKQLAIDTRSMLLVFKNNFQAAMLGLFGGIIVGIIPLLSIAFNLFILGYISGFLAFGKAHGLLVFAVTVLPHGIVEIPLFLLAASFGLRLGFFWRLPCPMSDWEKLKKCLQDNLKLVPVLFFGFLLAAFLEVFVSGFLAERYLNLIPPP